MGDDLSLDERASVRTPMQCSSRLPNAGFSDADAGRLVRRPVLVDAPGGAAHGVHVEDESAERDSLLDELSRLVRVRRQVPEIGTGRWHIAETGCGSVVAVRYDTQQTSVLTLVNVSDEEVQVQPRASEELQEIGDVLADTRYDRPHQDRPLTLRPHGYRWIRGRSRR